MKFLPIIISICAISNLAFAMERQLSCDEFFVNSNESKLSQDEQFEQLDETQRNLSQDELSDSALEKQRRLLQDEVSDTSSRSIKDTEGMSLNPKDDYIRLSDESYSEEAKLMLTQARNYKQYGEKALLFRNILVHGPQGSGKTTFIKQIAALMGQEISKVKCDTFMARVVYNERANVTMQYIPGIYLMDQLAAAIFYTRTNVVRVKNLSEMLQLLRGDFDLNLRYALKSINKRIKKQVQKIVCIEWAPESYGKNSKNKIETIPHCIPVYMNPLSCSDSIKLWEFHLKKLRATDYMPSSLHSLPALLVYNAKKIKLEQDMKALSIAAFPAQK